MVGCQERTIFVMLKDRLKATRLEKGLTQTEIAKLLDTSYQNYANWERGVRTPKESTIQKLSEALGVTPDYLTGQNYVINLEPYNPTEEDIKAVKQLIDNYFKTKQ